jgi:hypothetical protein
VSLNAIIQSPGTSYTIANSQITFSQALTSSDVIDFILILGDTLDVGVPSDDSVGLPQLSATGTPSSSNYLRGDNSWQTVSAGTSLSGSTDNTVTTVTGANAIQGETNFIYNGTIVGAGADGANADLGTGLHVKTADSSASVSGDADELVLENSGHSGLSIFSGTSSTGSIHFGDSGDNDIGNIIYQHNDNTMRFRTNGTERLFLGSDGDVGVLSDGSPVCRFHVKRANNGTMIYGENTTSSGVDAAQFIIQCNDTDGGYDLIHAKRSSTVKFLVEHDGDCQNANNSYGSTSDERIKQDITDANSQWDDIKALNFKNFKLKSDVASGNKIGVIAQDLETDGMSGLVKEHRPSAKDIEVNSDFGTLYEDGDVLPKNKRVGDVKTETSNVKTVKYSVLYMKAIKALQEAQTRIETLENKVEALENK